MSDFLSENDIDIIKKTYLVGATESEIKMFLKQCERTQLDPFSRQIYSIARYDSKKNLYIRQTQVSIDGARLIAQRSGQYEGQVGPYWCGDDGKWVDVWIKDEYPRASKLGVFRKNFREPCWGIANWESYAQTYQENNQIMVGAMWKKMPALMLNKCFAKGTEILTDKGFLEFSKVKNEKIMQVTKDLKDIEPTNAKPFCQKYNGENIEVLSHRLNFSVTPNHDMLTTFGKVEALAMYETSHSRGPWTIPLKINPEKTKTSKIHQLIGAFIADGSIAGATISVSKKYKIDFLEKLNLHSNKYIERTKGRESQIKGRVIRTNFDQITFSYSKKLISVFDENKIIKDYMKFSQGECKDIVDAWIYFGGYENNKTGVRRLYSPDIKKLKLFEYLAIKSGYTISTIKKRETGYCISISSLKEEKVFKNKSRSSIRKTKYNGDVWCVTVPSGLIVVRYKGLSMVCGNCAEMLALRKAFPQELSGLYSQEEMSQQDNADVEDINFKSNQKKEEKHILNIVEEKARLIAELKSELSAANKNKDNKQKMLFLETVCGVNSFNDFFKMESYEIEDMVSKIKTFSKDIQND